MKRLLHNIAHFLGWNGGDVETWWSGARLMVGFRCAGCKELQGVDEVPDRIAYPEGR